jgi:hypothetical protein
VAILETIERNRHGGNRKGDQAQDLALGRKSRPEAAKAAGFGGRETARQAATVVKRGAPELVEAMDRGEIAIEPVAAR